MPSVSSLNTIRTYLNILVLRSLVRNPNGMFWAGDTAQTISLGSSFRFNDLKAFLFRLEVIDMVTNCQSCCSEQLC